MSGYVLLKVQICAPHTIAGNFWFRPPCFPGFIRNFSGEIQIYCRETTEIDIVVKSPLGTVDLLPVGEINMGQRLPLLQKRRDELVQFFQGFRRLIDSGSGERFDVLVGIICEFCPVEEEIMGAGTQLRTAVADIRGLKKPGTEPGRKVWAVKRSPFQS